MSRAHLEAATLHRSFDDLKRDLLSPEGPRISTMRNYRFAIVPYPPEREFECRRRVAEVTAELGRSGWQVLDISLQRIMLDRLRRYLDPDEISRLIEYERRSFKKDPLRALPRLRDKLAAILDGEDGVAADIIASIGTLADQHPDATESTLIWISRLGPTFPFMRASSLLKHLDGKTRQIPVVLLYPGERDGPTGLSFMGEGEADRDYRPRIY